MFLVPGPIRSDHRLASLVEDNDPSGNLSNKGIAAKKAARIVVFKIPKRSPDLNVLDYAIWARIERLMRLQERKFTESKREDREQFEERLDRTAKALPKAFVNNAIKNLKERFQRCYKAKGGLFEEGGRSAKKTKTAKKAA